MKYFLIIVSVILSSFVFAQNEVKNNVTTETKELTDQLDMGLVHNNQINKIVLKFCNEGLGANQLTSTIDLTMRPNQKKEVCVAIVNQSNDTLEIVGSVVPGSINANGNMVCSNAGELIGDVFVSNFAAFSEPVVLGPQEQRIDYFVLSANEIASGKYNACFAINLTTTEKLSANSPFNLVIRKAGNIKISVEGGLYRFQWFNDILFFIEKNTRIISIIGLVACGLLLLSVLIPMFRGKNKVITKKTTHKK
ncbi:MAG: hypothetical protein PHR61_03440 [Candidatus Absconditabacteria bacterium]|nr:hypothetical protein [Candidatus Absconditabacteria bacterium]